MTAARVVLRRGSAVARGPPTYPQAVGDRRHPSAAAHSSQTDSAAAASKPKLTKTFSICRCTSVFFAPPALAIGGILRPILGQLPSFMPAGITC
ncbi:hypothetical protein MUK42_07495 [Musa troglodytarum]|uniref:Uncharacterized protein n=1 Tax=Musa troglodytarum TaxID=320322 RepID=A0A9E7JDY5_9LILI|nr:hypothetical protein MUK42_05756 [Musa troglodytarum]URD81819.1 hypothetical protein MUK42_07495 [Musa troglodytarum]